MTTDWKFLPDLILEQIFYYLSRRDRLSASCTCIPWYETFHNPCLWKKFIYAPPSYLEQFSQRIYYDIATYNLSMCFKNIGYSFQSILIPPISNYFILNRSLNVMSDFYRKNYTRCNKDIDMNPFCDYRNKLEIFSFEFDSQIINENIYGTGGALLTSIRKLLDILSNLKSVRLKSLLLTSEDRIGLLDKFVVNNRESLVSLSLVDISKSPLTEFDVVNFSNLTELELSSFQIRSDFLISLVQETKIETLILTQTRFTLFSEEFFSIEPIPGHVWELANEITSTLKVHQRYIFNNISEFIDLNTVSIIYQPKPAPVTRFIFTSNNTSILDLIHVEQYGSTLEEIIIIINSATESAIKSSIDEELLMVIGSLSSLTTLVLGGERLSLQSSTILCLLSDRREKLRHLYIQSNTLQYRFDGISMNMYHPNLSDDLIYVSTDPDLFRSTVRAQLKQQNWNLLSERQFSQLVEKNRYFE